MPSRRRLRSRRRFGQTPSQQRPRPRQNDYPTRIVILNESASEGSLRQQLQILRDLGLLEFLGSGSPRDELMGSYRLLSFYGSFLNNSVRFITYHPHTVG